MDISKQIDYFTNQIKTRQNFIRVMPNHVTTPSFTLEIEYYKNVLSLIAGELKNDSVIDGIISESDMLRILTVNALRLKPDQLNIFLSKIDQRKVVCPNCKSKYLTYTELEYYQCNSCPHTWTD